MMTDTPGVRLWDEASALLPEGARMESTRWPDASYSVHVTGRAGGWEIHLTDTTFEAVMRRIVESLRVTFHEADLPSD